MFDTVMTAAWFALVFYSVRAVWVQDYRVRLVGEVACQSQRDETVGLDWRWRFRQFDAAHSSLEMILKFWRPVSSFYAGARCLQPWEELEV